LIINIILVSLIANSVEQIMKYTLDLQTVSTRQSESFFLGNYIYMIEFKFNTSITETYSKPVEPTCPPFHYLKCYYYKILMCYVSYVFEFKQTFIV